MTICTLSKLGYILQIVNNECLYYSPLNTMNVKFTDYQSPIHAVRESGWKVRAHVKSLR
jgi:hypothetical protein